MKKSFIASLIVAAILVAPVAHCRAEFTLKDAVLQQKNPNGINAMIPAADGNFYYELIDGGSKIVKREYKTGKIAEDIFDSSTARDCNITKWDGFQFSPNEQKILLYTNVVPIYRNSFKADYYIFEIRHNKLTKLSDEGGEEIATFSPNGRMVAYVKDNNAYVAKLDYGTNIAITSDGEKNKIINAVPDWVYQEEFGLINSFSWSPDNLMLAFIRWDETKVPLYSMQLYETDNNGYCLFPGEFEYKYPMAGQNNATTSVLSYDVETRVLKTIQLPNAAEDSYIPSISFTSDPSRLMVSVLNRTQNRFQLFAANPRSTISKLIYQEEAKCWIDYSLMSKMRFYDDFIIIPSEKDGYAHLYKHSASGAFIKQLTSGSWNVTEYYGYDPVNKLHYIQTTQEGPLNRVIATVDDKTGKVTVISECNGTHNAQFNSDFTYFVEHYSSYDTPDQYLICNNRGKSIRELEMNKPYANKYASGNVPSKEFFTIQSDGNTLNGYIIKPVDFDQNKKYPVIMSQYSGPGSQQVLNEWKMDWEQYFATQGYIVVCVDGRGTGGRSREFRDIVYMNLGKYESIDQIAAARHMASLPYVDASSIGIWGWSYGGYETLMAMSQPNSIYAAGVAIAPVTDWRFYDTIYAERYMRTPQENENGYISGSPLERAASLKGRLMIIAGTADDNVHITNALNYIARLQQHDKLFNMMVFPNKNHSINGNDTRYVLYRQVLDFFDTYLKK